MTCHLQQQTHTPVRKACTGPSFRFFILGPKQIRNNLGCFLPYIYALLILWYQVFSVREGTMAGKLVGSETLQKVLLRKAVGGPLGHVQETSYLVLVLLLTCCVQIWAVPRISPMFPHCLSQQCFGYKNQILNQIGLSQIDTQIDKQIIPSVALGFGNIQRGYLAMSRDILVVTTGRGTTNIKWILARDAAKYSVMGRTAPQQGTVWPKMARGPR